MPTSEAEPALTSAAERPWLFAFLIAPPAVIAIGLISGALSYLLRHEGIDPARASGIVALLALPHTIYFLWSPVADFGLRRRTWVLAGSAASAIVMAVAFHRHSLASPWAVRLFFLGYCLAMIVAASAGGLMGALQSEVNRRRAGSFYQCGSLLLGGLVVFAMVSLADRFSLGMLGWIVAAAIFLPSLFALAVPRGDPPSAHGLRETLAGIASEFRLTFLRWDAIPYTLLIVLPMCSGAMLGLLPALAVDFGVSSAQVAWMNGLGGVLLTALGSMSAALIPVRIRAPIAYLLAGIVNAATLLIFALGPQRPAIYFAGTVLFLFTIGLCYSLFTGVVLEFLGDSGKSGGARYSIINSFGNVPVAYMTFVDGRGYAHWGPRGMPGIDAAFSIAAASLLLIYFLLRRAPRPVAA
ncbi:MAG TPA: MFS transporter [Terracidiphilus sp.]|jgi:PAT family beta-lactamase induction signal transducer AmpG|nr:MFS transporter [Terracidiphilus sp.]